MIAVSTSQFGVSLGLTGAIILHREGSTAQITDATFSCGIIGRGFEPKAILELLKHLKKQGVELAEVLVTLTGTNLTIRDHLKQLGFTESSRNAGQSTYSLDLRKDLPDIYDWISLISGAPEMNYVGHPAVISFFSTYIKPLIEGGNAKCIVNLGSARGEVLGHLQEGVRDEFYRFLDANHAEYIKVDIEPIPGEQNIVANAENLIGVISSESKDLVMAIELLEHSEHFWQVINEAIRVCKTGGYIFISVPSFGYPKHEYPIDVWRIGPKTLSSFFEAKYFEIVALRTECICASPRPNRTMIFVKKTNNFKPVFEKPIGGSYNAKTGITTYD